jgi:hypothetical protein
MGDPGEPGNAAERLRLDRMSGDDYDDHGGAYEQLERIAFGAEEIRFATPEERGAGVPMKVELKTIGVFGFSNNEASENLKDAVCRYACDHGYRDFFQGLKNVRKIKGRFQIHQRILYLEHSIEEDVKQSLGQLGNDLSKILEDMKRRGLVSEVIRSH